jgi:adenine-specific DNA-methyltransferase
MTGISKERRARARECARRLREHLVSSSASSGLVRDLEMLASEVDDSRLGLIWEESDEPAARLLTGDLPELEEVTKLRIGSNARFNYLIEGENLAVLTLLAASRASTVDVVCIDPPYNTGMRDLGYGDHDAHGDLNPCRHDRWLSFMERRLVLARSLMSETGTMFLHLDEHEAATAMLLCGQIFGEDNTDLLVWPKTDPRFDQNRVEKPFRTVKMVHEYVIACYRNRAMVRLNKVLRPVSMDGGWTDIAGDLESIVGGWGTTSSAKDELAAVFGGRNRFRTPKPRRLIKEFVRAASQRDSVVLDFFAGSGTTGHAVMDLNQEDGGGRTFILVNNDENDICRQVAYERLKAAITHEAYPESLRYFVLRSGEGKTTTTAP